MKLSPFWQDDFPRPRDLQTAPWPDRVDVAVVGAGYTGLSAGLTLAKQGISVAVLDRGEVGSGASSANGGQLCTGLKQRPQVVFERYGREIGRELWQASVSAVNLVEQILAEEGIDCDYQQGGSLSLATKPAHFERMSRGVEWLARELGYERKLVPPCELQQEIGSDTFYGGVLDERGGGLHPAKYVYGLARATVRAGALLLEKSEVRQIDRQSTGFRLTSPRGTLQAGEVLIATNGYTGSLVPEMRRRVFPVGSYIVTTEPLSPKTRREVSPRGRMFFDTRWLLNYFRLTPDGRIAMGGRNNLSPDLSLEESARKLKTVIRRIFPQLGEPRITHSWTGRLGCTFDLLPHVGRIRGIHYAFGYCGHGVGLATYLGREAACLISGQIRRSPFSEIPHATQVYYWKKAWFLPLAALYYRVLDKFS